MVYSGLGCAQPRCRLGAVLDFAVRLLLDAERLNAKRFFAGRGLGCHRLISPSDRMLDCTVNPDSS